MQRTGGRIPHDVFQGWSRNRPESHRNPIVYHYTTVLTQSLRAPVSVSRRRRHLVCTLHKPLFQCVSTLIGRGRAFRDAPQRRTDGPRESGAFQGCIPNQTSVTWNQKPAFLKWACEIFMGSLHKPLHALSKRCVCRPPSALRDRAVE